jgi:hypothetical protein
MVYFLVVFAVSVLALLLVQRLDIECVNQPAPRRRLPVKPAGKRAIFMPSGHQLGAD